MGKDELLLDKVGTDLGFWLLELEDGSKGLGIVAEASEEWEMGNPSAKEEETGWSGLSW